MEVNEQGIKTVLDTSIGEVEVVRATLDELGHVLDLWLEAASWLEELGIRQWRANSFHAEAVREHWAKTELFVAKLDGAVIATFSLQWTDERIWGERNSVDAGYLHRLAVARSCKGFDLGRLLLSWAEGYAGSKGKSKLRLDCMADNSRLNAFYIRAGFTYLTRVDHNYFSASLFEKVIG